ncbi:MAG: O-antigen ligase protein [Thermoleophilia bacterium]|nr:O-antigen ligase protein [Thermoleophilia bacterium]
MPAASRTDRPAPPIDIAVAPLLVAGAVVCWLPAATVGKPATQAFAALAMGGLIAMAFARDPFAARRLVRAAGALLTLLVIWYVASRAWAFSPGGSMREAARLAAFAMFVYAGHVSLVRSSSRLIALAALAAIGFAVGAPSLWDVLSDGAPKVRLHGYLDYWNATGIVALSVVPLAALLLRSRRFALSLMAAPLIASAAAAAAVTASRGALAAALASLIVLVLLDPNRRVAIAASIVTAVVLIGGVALLSFTDVAGWVSIAIIVVLLMNAALGFRRAGAGPIELHEPPTERRLTPVRILGGVICAGLAAVVLVLAVAASNDGDAEAPVATVAPEAARLTSTDDSKRFEWWELGAKEWSEAPIIGRGGEAFETLALGRKDGTAEHVHSSPLQLLLEAGVIGFLLAIAAIALLVRSIVRADRTPGRAAGAAIVAMVLVQGLIDWTWSLPQVMLVSALALIVALPRSRAADGEAPMPRIPALLGVIAAAGLLTTVAILPVGADLFADEAARSFDAGRFADSADEAHLAMQLVPTLETLELEVAALARQGREERAESELTRAESVWSRRPEGLAFAQEWLADDPEYGPKIERELKRFAKLATDTTSKP